MRLLFDFCVVIVLLLCCDGVAVQSYLLLQVVCTLLPSLFPSSSPRLLFNLFACSALSISSNNKINKINKRRAPTCHVHCSRECQTTDWKKKHKDSRVRHHLLRTEERGARRCHPADASLYEGGQGGAGVS